MSILPFVCLGTGIVMGFAIKRKELLKAFDTVATVSLTLMMVCIGIGIGIDKSIMNEFPKIGFNCVVIAISVLFFSMLFTVICEKTVLPLGKYEQELKASSEKDEETQEGNGNSMIWILPASLILGLVGGVFLRNSISSSLIDKAFTVFLIILYICVGVSQGANKEVFSYIKALGFRILWLPFAVFCGSIIGGIIPPLFLDVPMHISVISAGGMSFYSLTGAYMSQTYGLAYGTYGFIVNVLREFITIFTMPILVKISKGCPIAGGAAGDMDTMLAPVTKFVGPQLGLVTLLTGTVLTFVVPILLPILTNIFS
ncbi:MAG: lysine exporter LysO family protein [Clostridiales bacterium]|nr:lysine exporter LysO family protein [Clostridiales bacterium]